MLSVVVWEYIPQYINKVEKLNLPGCSASANNEHVESQRRQILQNFSLHDLHFSSPHTTLSTSQVVLQNIRTHKFA